MADTKISALTALVGSGVDTTADVLPIVDTSATTTKKILIDELAIAMGTTLATQAQMETATSAVTTVRPSNQHFHPGMPKAWGMITPNTTVTVSYPAAGVSVVKGGVGTYTVTHGRTFSGSYSVVVTPLVNLVMMCNITGKGGNAFDVTFYDQTFALADPTSFDYVCFGDL